jgi:signal transduction histidine kinase
MKELGAVADFLTGSTQLPADIGTVREDRFSSLAPPMQPATDTQKHWSDTRFRRVLEGGRLGYSVLGPGGDVRLRSPVDRDAAETTVQAYLQSLSAGAAEAGRELRERAFAVGTPYSCFVKATIAGRPVVLHLRGIPFPGTAGEVESLLEVVQDVTEAERESRDETVRRTLEAAIATLAHEINNPLASIVGSVDLLLLLALPRHQRAELEKILGQARRIATVLDQIRTLLPAELVTGDLAPRIALDPRVRTGFAR